MATAKGYAVVDGEAIGVNTVSETIRAAIVNWLVVARSLDIRQSHSDADIEVFWESLRQDARVIEVEVAPRPSAAGKFTALIGCQIEGCAEEVSHHLDMVMLYKGEPICQGCYEEVVTDEDRVDWHDLPAIGLKDLRE